jgi:hypothetical protein
MWGFACITRIDCANISLKDNPLGLVANDRLEVQCPTCHVMVSLGGESFANYYRRHRGSKKCSENLKKYIKQQAAEDQKKKGGIQAFFTRQTTQSTQVPSKVPSTTRAPARILPTPKSTSSLPSGSTWHVFPNATHILNEFHQKIMDLPLEIPVADETHPLAQFIIQVPYLTERMLGRFLIPNSIVFYSSHLISFKNL